MKNTCPLLLALIVIGPMPVSPQTLREAANQRGVKIGAAIAPAHLGETEYAATAAREFNQVEPENAMKFGPIQPGPQTFNWAPADVVVAFAQQHGMAVRGHNLVWHRQNPGWITSGHFTADQLHSILQDHITKVVIHYHGQIYAWDVVNEAFNADGTLRSTIWADSPGIGMSGTAYIEQAFRWAHAADPKALLFYNDYDAEVMNAKSDSIYRMAKDFKARGVPLDGIGLQMHFKLDETRFASMEANIKRIAELGLQVQITELDVRIPVGPSGEASAADLRRQADVYRNAAEACLKFPQCTAIQTWGFTDKYSWIPHEDPGFGAGLEFDTNYRPKPAFYALLDALRTR